MSRWRIIDNVFCLVALVGTNYLLARTEPMHVWLTIDVLIVTVSVISFTRGVKDTLAQTKKAFDE